MLDIKSNLIKFKKVIFRTEITFSGSILLHAEPVSQQPNETLKLLHGEI